MCHCSQQVETFIFFRLLGSASISARLLASIPFHSRLGLQDKATDSIQQMRETSPAFRDALLKSEKKRIVGVIAFVSFFAVLAAVRIFVLGSAMSAWSVVVAALVIAVELGLLRAVNRALQLGQAIPNSMWYVSSILECLFPAVGVAFLVSSRLLSDYRPLATRGSLPSFL